MSLPLPNAPAASPRRAASDVARHFAIPQTTPWFAATAGAESAGPPPQHGPSAEIRVSGARVRPTVSGSSGQRPLARDPLCGALGAPDRACPGT